MGAAVADITRWGQAPAWLLVFYSNVFFGCTGFSIVLPTMWPYLRELGANTSILAWAVAMYSVGEGTGGYVAGKLLACFPERPKLLLQGGMVLGALAAGLYSVAAVFGKEWAPLVLCAMRFFSGLDNGVRQTIEQTFIGGHVPAWHQTTIISRQSSFAITGIMVGPAFGAPLQAVNVRLPGLGLEINGNNGPGWVLCVVCCVNLLTTFLFFNPRSTKQGAPQQQQQLDAEEPAEEVMQAAPPSKAGLAVCYMCFFAVNLQMASLETITPVVAQRLYGWGPCLKPSTCPFNVSQTYVNLLLSCGGVLSLLMCVLMSTYLGAKTYGRERLAVSLGLVVLAFVNLDNIDWLGELPAERFVGDYLLGAFFGSLIRGPTTSLLNQVIGPHDKAPYMGLLFAAGALPRVFAPFLLLKFLTLPAAMRDADFEGVYEGPMPRTWLLYGSQGLLHASLLLYVQLARAAVKPHPAGLQRPGLGTPLLQDGSTPASPEGAWLPATPVAMREGIRDFALPRASSLSL